jgi:chaperonin GroES
MTLEEVQPIRGYLIVDPDTIEKKTESGIYIADTVTRERPQTGKVLKVGGDLKTEYGAIIDSPVKEGDNIIFKKWGGNEVKVDKKDYFFVRFDDVIGLC